MMLGTLEKNRVQEFEEQHTAKLKTTNKGRKTKLIEDFLRSRLEGKKDKFDEEEEEVRKNPLKYDIYEERDIVTVSEGGSTARKVNTAALQELDTAAVVTNKGRTMNINIGESGNNSVNEEVPEKIDSTSKIFGYYTSKKKRPMPDEYEEYCFNEEQFYPSILNECIELNLLLLEKIYNTFKRKAEKVVQNFRRDNFNHLKPKILEILEHPPEDLLARNKKRKDMKQADLEEETLEQEVNDQTVLIDKDQRIEETYDEELAAAEQSGLYQSDRDYAERLREEIDKYGDVVGSHKDDLLREEEERRRQALLAAMAADEGYDSGSIHSHGTSAIPDSREIEFQEPGLAMVDNNSDEDSMDEQDIVYYHKDDLTQFSKNLGLNKVRRRHGDPLKLSEEDYSDNTSNNASNLMGDQFFRSAISDIGEEPSDGFGDGSMFAGVNANGDRMMDKDGNLIPGGNRSMMAGGAFAGQFGRTSDGLDEYDENGKRRKSKKRKSKPAKLTAAQKAKLRAMNDIYGQDAEELGLSPRDKRYPGTKNAGRKKISKKGGLNGMGGRDDLDVGDGRGGRDGKGSKRGKGGRGSKGDRDGYDGRNATDGFGGRNGRDGFGGWNDRDGNRTALLPGMPGSSLERDKNRKRSKKSKDGKKGKGADSVADLRMERFKQLNLNKPKRPEGEYDKLRRKLQKFRKRKDLTFWMDYDSPYAEYLPHRFREWIPETKTGIVLDTNTQHLHATDKAHELSRIYSRGLSPGDAEKDPNLSRNDGKKINFFSASKPSSSQFRPMSNNSMTVESMGRMSSNKKSREMNSAKKKESPRRMDRPPPQHIDVYNDFLGPDDRPIPNYRESNDALNEETARSNNDFNIGPLYDYTSNDPFKNKGGKDEEIEDAEDEEIDFRPVKFNQLFD